MVSAMNGHSAFWSRVALAADMIPGFVMVTAGVVLVLAGRFPQLLALV